MKKIIKLTESDLTRIVRRVISEQKKESEDMTFDKNWVTIYNGLKTVTDSSGNMPKIINFTYEGKKMQSLNWGTFSEAGKKKKWGLGIDSHDPELVFATKDEMTSKKYESLTGKKCIKTPSYYSYELPLNYSKPDQVISTVKKIIKGMG
jgi:hypothetical protein